MRGRVRSFTSPEDAGLPAVPATLAATDASMLRMRISCCGNGISIPASAQGFGHGDGHIALKLKPGVLLTTPEAQLKLQRAVAKSQEESHGRALEQDARMRFRHSDEQFDHTCRDRCRKQFRRARPRAAIVMTKSN